MFTYSHLNTAIDQWERVYCLFFPTLNTLLAEVSCPLYLLVFSWLPYMYLFPKTAMKIPQKCSRWKDENCSVRVYYHWFCTSVFPTSNLMSSQRPIFNWLTGQTIKLLSISVSCLSVFYFLPTEVATCSPGLRIFVFCCKVEEESWKK